MKKQKIKELIKTSKEVIVDGSLENGAIVAANSDKAIYIAAPLVSCNVCYSSKNFGAYIVD
jgi:hypothetical protein